MKPVDFVVAALDSLRANPLRTTLTTLGIIIGVAAVIAASSLLFLILSQALTNRLIGLDFSAYLRSLARPALVTVVLYAILATVRPELADDGLVRCLQAAALTLIATGLCLRLFAWGPCLAGWRSLRGQGEGNT